MSLQNEMFTNKIYFQMKNFKKARIKEFVEMTDREMKFTVGGSGSDSGSGSGSGCSDFKCQCKGIGSWTGTYCSAQEIADAINKYCKDGGTCSAA